MELSVLERHRFMLQRLYQQQHNDPQMATTSNNSSITRANMSKPLLQCNSTFPYREPNKRKAEFDVEEEDANEQSEISTKIHEETSKVSEIQKPDYIHVRFRRGQATDSHSLAERARREKISKKMKCLQDLVPGCNNVTGKAGTLDEIINYVQSLQKQVEFLSMKLATLNSRLEFNTDNLFFKEIPAYITSLPAAEAQFNATNLTNQSQMLPQKSANSYVPIPDLFFDPSYISQISGWETDWPNLFNIGFH